VGISKGRVDQGKKKVACYVFGTEVQHIDNKDNQKEKDHTRSSPPNWLIGSIPSGPLVTLVCSITGHDDGNTNEKACDPRYDV